MAKPLVDDRFWSLVQPLIPVKPRRSRNPGRKPTPDRACLTGIIFVLRTGIQWEMLPREMSCGCGMTCWRRLRDWQAAGVWQKIHEVLLAHLNAAARQGRRATATSGCSARRQGVSLDVSRSHVACEGHRAAVAEARRQ